MLKLEEHVLFFIRGYVIRSFHSFRWPLTFLSIICGFGSFYVAKWLLFKVFNSPHDFGFDIEHWDLKTKDVVAVVVVDNVGNDCFRQHQERFGNRTLHQTDGHLSRG